MMNYYTANAIQVPTKLSDSAGGSVPRTNNFGGSGGRDGTGADQSGVGGGSYGHYAGNTSPCSLSMGLTNNGHKGGHPNQEMTNGMNNMRRNSSNSSLDVAATIFSSMQELETQGRNLSSLAGMGAGGGGATSALDGMATGRMGGMSGMGGGMSGMNSLGGMGMMGGTAAAAAAAGLGYGGGSHGNYSLSMATGSSAPSNRFAASRMSMGSNSANSLSMATGGDASSQQGTQSIQARAAALRRMEMEEMILKQCVEGIKGKGAGSSSNERSALLDKLSGGYAPRGSSRRNSHSSNNPLDSFTPDELLQEVARRQVRRNSRDLLMEGGVVGEAGGGQSMRRGSVSSLLGGSLLDAFSRTNSRDDLMDIYNQMRNQQQQHQQIKGHVNSLDSLSDLAVIMASAKNNGIELREDRAGGDESGESKKGGFSSTGLGDIVMVPTAKPDSKGGKKASEKSESTTSVVTADQSPCPEKMAIEGDKLTKKKRQNSTSSFDALLSVLEPELAEKDRRESDDKAGFFDSLVQKTAAAVAAKQKEEQASPKRRMSSNSSLSADADPQSPFTKKQRLSHMDAILSDRDNNASAVATLRANAAHAAATHTVPETSPRDAAMAAEAMKRARLMAQLEAMKNDELRLRERALREEQALRENALREEQIRRRLAAAGVGEGPNMTDPRFSALFGDQALMSMGGMGGIGGGGPLSHSDAAHAMLARLQGLPGPMQNGMHASHQQGPVIHLDPNWARKNKPLEEQRPPGEHPEVALRKFLNEYGEEGKKTRKTMLKAITDTERSLATIHAWDRSQGLRKCHSRTVVKTRRSRARIKAFLMGVDPPKEPKKKRKKSKKSALVNDDFN